MKYEVLRQQYERFEPSAMQLVTFEAETDKQAMEKVIENCMYGLDEPGSASIKELKCMIDEDNGDGCDFIFYIKNIDKEKLIFKSNYSERKVNW